VACTLKELLTVKSDGVVGCVKRYEAIAKCESALEPGASELLKEFQPLALAVVFFTENRQEIEIKIRDHDMTDTARHRPLVGGETAMRQKQIAVRKAEAQWLAALALKGGIEEPPIEDKQVQDTEESDEQIAADQKQARAAVQPLRAMSTKRRARDSDVCATSGAPTFPTRKYSALKYRRRNRKP
jgi:hypothetical protein